MITEYTAPLVNAYGVYKILISYGKFKFQKNINNIDHDDDDINFKAIFRFFNRSKNLILGVVFTSSFVTSLYAFLTQNLNGQEVSI